MDDKGAGIGIILLIIFVVVAVVAVPKILGDTANRRAAESDARAVELQAQAALEQQRAQNDAERSERSHRQALEVLPYLALIVGGIIVLAIALVLGIPFAMRLMQQSSRAAPQLSVQPVVYLVMPGNMPRADQWRALEERARGQPGQVTIYQEREGG